MVALFANHLQHASQNDENYELKLQAPKELESKWVSKRMIYYWIDRCLVSKNKFEENQISMQ